MFIPVVELASSVSVKALDGRPLSSTPVTHVTQSLELMIGPSHSEKLQLYVLPHDQLLVILGFLWLHFHNPTIGWQSANILSWSPCCQITCIPKNKHLHVTLVEVPTHTHLRILHTRRSI